MIVEIITPEKSIFTGEASAVSLPGTNGVFQVLNSHAPIISSLKKGEIRLQVKEIPKNNEVIRKISSNEIGVEVNGGIVELINDKLVVLAN